MQDRTTNNLDQIEEVDAAVLTYSDTGNVFTAPAFEEHPALKYEYDAFNRLRKVRKSDDTLLVEYRYDASAAIASGRRVRAAATDRLFCQCTWRREHWQPSLPMASIDGRRGIEIESVKAAFRVSSPL